MSQLLEIITDNHQDDKKQSKRVNFIQKNKQQVASKKSKTTSNPDVVIRYLNDHIDDSVKVIKSTTRIELNSSNESTNNKENELEQSNQIEFEISIISNHDSSIVTDKEDDNNQNEIADASKNNHQDVNSSNHLIQGDEYKPEADLLFSSNYLKLNPSKKENNLKKGEKSTDEEDEVNIIKSDEDKFKVRSQFMQRSSKKKQIIPNIIDSTPLTATTTCDSTPSTLQFNNRLADHQFSKPDQDALTTASIAASLAAMSVVNAHQQPLVKIQHDLEEKIENVLKELESLRRSDDLINEKLKRKSRVKYESDCSDDECKSIRKSIESESRIKHLEKLQEKQFDMMSQLINKIGSENSQALLTAKNGKENLNKFKKQINDTLENAYDDAYDDENEDYIQFKNNLNKKHEQSVKKPRSRSQSKRVPNSNTLSKAKKSSEIRKSKSRSPSATRSCCKMRNSPNKQTLPVGKKTNRKSEFLEELLDVDKVDTEELEPCKEQPVPLPQIVPLKSATYSAMPSMHDETLQPLLFDKYLNEVKTKLKVSESLDEKEKTVAANSNNNNKKLDNEMSESKPSLFGDIKEVLKAVEYSKAKIDASLAELSRERDNKMFYLLNSDEKSDRLRIKKMVDGCINAIADDVKREVDEKLIDESKNAKLNAEKDSTKFKRHMKSQQPKQQPKTVLRSASAANLPTSASNVSQTRKYIDKLFGKQLLDQIKLEKSKEMNRELENKLKEQQRLKKELELKIKKEMSEIEKSKSKPFKNIANTDNASKKAASKPKSYVSPVETTRKDEHTDDRIVITPRLVLDPNNLPQMHVIQPAISNKPLYIESNYQEPRSSSSRVAVITLPSVDIPDQLPSPTYIKPKKELIKQNLPPVNISPESRAIDSETRSIDSTSIQREQHDNETFDVNQTGTGIEIPGFRGAMSKNTSLNQSHKLIAQNSNLISDRHISQLANETTQLSKQIDLFENKTYDWLEQELMARFISKLAHSEPHVHDAEYSNDFEQQSETSEQLDLKDLDIISALGQQGLQLFVDIGQPVDQDLVQALIREVLEEKVASMALNRDLADEASTKPSVNVSAPIPSPRARKSIEIPNEFNNQQVQFSFEVKTPVPTPSQSPPQSPRHPILTPQISVEPQQPQVEPLTMNYINQEDDESSILEKTINENDNVEVELADFDTKQTIQVETPHETPAPSPVPDQIETPSDSSQSEKIKIPPIQLIQQLPPSEPSPRPEPPIMKTFRSKSMQCDEIVLPKPQPTPVIVEPTRSDTSSHLTESTQYTSDDSSSITTTISSNQKSENEDEDTYISEGAWLISKSEGEIKQIKSNEYLAGLINSNKNVNLNEVNSDTSDGEMRPERGEVKSARKDTEKSEGELDSLKASSSKSNKSKVKTVSNRSKSNLKLDKTVVDLKLSPNSKSKNNIRIESLSTEIKTRDSNDFDRKLFSSTPDTTLNRVIPNIGKPIQDEEELFNDEYSSDEQEVELEYTP